MSKIISKQDIKIFSNTEKKNTQQIENISITNCDKGCCTFKTNINYVEYKTTYGNTKKNKAGVILFDITKSKILLVQSKNRLYGFPKGSLSDNETPIDAAVRELKEEANIDVKKSQLGSLYIIDSIRRYKPIKPRISYSNCGRLVINCTLNYNKNKKYAYYYILNTDLNDNMFNVQLDKHNDVNKCVLLSLSCLQDYIKKGQIRLNNHCIKILKLYLNIDYNKLIRSYKYCKNTKEKIN